MFLSTAKKSAILQLCNSISSSSCAISNLNQLSNGEFFVNTISSTFPEFLKDPVKSESKDVDHHEDLNVIPTTTDTPEAENAVLKVESTEIDKSSVGELDELPGDTDILQRFTFIKKFIDEHYVIKSEEIISYNQCVESNEFELAKVAIFVLSEVVKHFVLIKNDQLQTLSHLDIQVQEDLEECFNFFITDRFKISKTETEKILCHPAKYKVPSSSMRSPFATPQRNCSSKYRRSLSTSTPSNEDVFTNSPLTSFFESPIFKKEDIFVKNKELEKVTKALFEEEQKREDLQFELKDVKKKMLEKEKEVQKLKQENAQLNERYQKLLSSECTNEACRQKFEKEISYYKKRCDELHAEIMRQYAKVTKLEKSQEQSCSESSKGYIKTSILRINKQMEIKLQVQDAQIHSLKDEVERLRWNSETSKDSFGCKSILSEKDSSLKEEPVTPVGTENVGTIIEEDYRKLQAESTKDKLKIEKLTEENMKLTEENMRLKEGVKKEQNQFSFRNSSDHSSMPKLLDLNDLAEKERLRSVKTSESINELTSLPIDCFPLNSSVIEYKQPSSSAMLEWDPSTLNMSGAVLWRRCNSDSQLANNLSTDHMDIEGNLSIGKDAIAVRWEDLGSSSDIQENTAKTDSANVKDDSNLELLLNPFNAYLKNGYSKRELTKVLRRLSNGSNGHSRGETLKVFYPLIATLHKNQEEAAISNSNKIREMEYQLTEKSSLLNEKEDELSKLKSEYDSLEKNYQTTVQEKDAMKKTAADYQERLKLLKSRFRDLAETYKERKETLKQLSLKHNCLEKEHGSLTKKYKLVVEKSEEKDRELSTLVKKEIQIANLRNRLALRENDIKELQEKLNTYKSKYFQVKERLKEPLMSEAALKKKVKELTVKLNNLNTAQETVHSSIERRALNAPRSIQDIEDPRSSYNSVTFLPDFSVTPHDESNLSGMSSALYRRTQFPLENQDEDDFLNHSSLFRIKEELPEDRMEELKRRNSILPIHLQSSYPTEANLPLHNDSLYVRNLQKEKSSRQENPSEFNSKKRKLDDSEVGSQKDQSESSVRTPVRKMKRFTTRTSASMKKLLLLKRNRPEFVKPKP